jgi:UDP-N-acetylglucosamine:LPS N-acetylglucosamine transferase
MSIHRHEPQPSEQAAAHAGAAAAPPPSGRAHRVLLLTSGLGSGHWRAAQAVEAAWRSVDAQATVRILDFWSLMDPAVAGTIQRSYLRLVSEQPELYDRAYHLDQRLWRAALGGGALPAPLRQVLQLFTPDAFASSRGSRRLDRWLFLALLAALKGRAWGWPGVALRRALLGCAYLLMTRRLAAQCRAFGTDVIVVNEMWPAVLASMLKTGGRVTTPVVGLLTDFGVHDLWVQPGIDHYCVATSQMQAALYGAGVPESRVSVTGIALMPGFRHLPSRDEARRALGLDPARPVILLLGGGLGLGVEDVARQLASGAGGVQWLVVAGRNAAVAQRLQALAHAASIKVCGWTEQMEQLVRAADLVVGKPGGLTLAEALACGRPLLATHCLRGQEGFNVRFLEAHGVGALVRGEDLAATVAALLGDRQRLAQMQARAWQLGHRDSALQVVAIARKRSDEARAVARPATRFGGRILERARLIVQGAMRGVDDLYRRHRGLQPVGEALYVGRTRYHGPVREFDDGTRLVPGDVIGTLHFNNSRLSRIEADSAARAALRFARLMLDSMRALAARARQDAAHSEPAIYHAVTWLPPHGRAIGFCTEAYPDGARKRLLAAYFRLLVWAFAPAEQTRAAARPTPTVYWLTRNELLQRFGATCDDTEQSDAESARQARTAISVRARLSELR